jgi:EAL domain-containing protein (putative c-di-GMP-specific phosphodiesterase class I)
MLAKAAATCRVAREAGHDVKMSVNVSIKSLADVTFADQITNIVRGEGVEPQWMVVEITESAATTSLGTALENLARLRMKGFGLSIDDYGTGYSSLEQLIRIPFTELKIDQSFVAHAARRESAMVILESSLDMAKRLKLCAVAEGVETQENWDLLAKLGCDIAQGYYVSRPVEAAAFLEFLTTWPKMHGR